MSKKALWLAEALCNAGLVGAPLDSEVAAELRRLAALNEELVEALTLMCRSRGSPQPIPPESAYVAAYAALSKAKEQA